MVPTTPQGDSDPRVELCLSLGFGGIIVVHGLVVAGAKGAIEKLTAKGLKARNLTRLSYSASALKALGYNGEALEKLGFKRVAPKGDSTEGSVQPPGLYHRPLPEYWAFSHRQYGLRVGVFRVLEALARHGVTPTVAMPTSAPVHERRRSRQPSDIGWGMKLCSHCRNVRRDEGEPDDMDGKR